MDEQDKALIQPGSKPDAAVILLHGLGADGHDFEPLAPELNLPDAPSIRWVFPHAPVRPVTVNGGYRMRAWYDIIALDPEAPEDETGIREAARTVGSFIRAEREQGIPDHRIVLAGFSQGGAAALFTALRWPERLAGVVALSCYLPLPGRLTAEAHPANKAVRIFMAHGTADPVVPLPFGEAARDQLTAMGCDVEWHTYQIQHGLCAQEVGDLRAWLLGVLPGLTSEPPSSH